MPRTGVALALVAALACGSTVAAQSADLAARSRAAVQAMEAGRFADGILVNSALVPDTVENAATAEMKKIMSDPEMKKLASNIGLIPVETPSVDGIEKYFATERDKWGSLVRKLGLQGSM